MDYNTIKAQRIHLLERIGEKPVDMVRLSGRSLFLGFGGETAVKLACIPDMPYLFGLEHRFIPVRDSKDWFAAKLKDTVVNEINIAENDRILTFVFNSGLRLVFELTGRHANIIMLDDSGTITGSLRSVTKHESSYREIMPGAKYLPPPSKTFLPIAGLTTEVMAALLPEMKTAFRKHWL